MCVQAFKTCLHHIIIIDETHLKGKYLGTMFKAVGMDVVFPNAWHRLCCLHFVDEYENTDTKIRLNWICLGGCKKLVESMISKKYWLGYLIP
uniref:MULE transposase domain-containing protein n=1 Tax=Lactuca sativa TaxID=4236 RepID=A0A9R1XGX1_LACSA|nr:hypothetical protein LSAT_V11C400175880 [Lactuca sativa]